MRELPGAADKLWRPGRWSGLVAIGLILLLPGSSLAWQESRLAFEALPDLPDAIGVAGPLVGIHNDHLLVAGGANFAPPDHPQLWDLPKQYLDTIHVLPLSGEGPPDWRTGRSGRLPQPVAYSAVVSTPYGVLCLGGEDETGPLGFARLMRYRDSGVELVELPFEVPFAFTAGTAAVLDDWIYLHPGLVAGQVDGEPLPVAGLWRIPLASLDPARVDQGPWRWERLPDLPPEAGPRGHSMLVVQHDGFSNRLYLLGGRRPLEATDSGGIAGLRFLADIWSIDPADISRNPSGTPGDPLWRRETDSPVPLSAGTAVSLGPAHILVPAYADGSGLQRQQTSGRTMREFDHPGFPATALCYHTVTRSWTESDAIPANQVTTPAVTRDGTTYLISGEIRPRVRTNRCWKISLAERPRAVSRVDQGIVVLYLLAMLGLGVWFTWRNQSTDDFFRAGKRIHWLVAGCSIFATMLSSITYMAIPAKAFAQDWVYLVGNFMILAVAPVAIYVALPFFRRIDATSAYEYLELRFSRLLRCLGSASFTLFHVFRIGVVLALAGLALTSVIPLTPAQCVITMGLLSLAYSTLGGISAVVWTDTVQTGVLLAGALVCLGIAWFGAPPGALGLAVESGKFRMVNVDFGSMSFATMAIWVVVLGALGQNLSSYTADQAVVQRYMTTPGTRQAARSIWFNGLLAIPAGLLFFGLGTALWMFYRGQPELLDPGMAADRILPMFITRQLPVGIAGIVVAGIFAAAQSTVSTSMNSGASTLVTDFVRVAMPGTSPRALLATARGMTLAMGVLGTATGLLFVSPDIRSLFDEFVGVLGLFLGVVAGLFALGATSRRANAAGSLTGAVIAMLVMSLVFLAGKDQAIPGWDPRLVLDALPGPPLYRMSGYLYATTGLLICYLVGWLASVLTGGCQRPLSGLTIYDR